MKFIAKFLEDNVNVPPIDHGREFFKFAGITAAIVFGLYFILGFIAENLASRLSPHLETKIAGMFVDKIEKDHMYVRTSAYAQKVLDRLVKTAKDLPPFVYKVYVIKEDEANAMALPGGNIVIFEGLIKPLNSENGLAMVLAHELGHYVRRDHLRGLGRGLITMVLAETLRVSGQGLAIFTPSLGAMDLKFSREQEGAADLYAFDLVVSAYGHPYGIVEVLDILLEKEKGMRWLTMFSTHPDTLWRKKVLETRIAARYKTVGNLTPLPSDKGLPFPEDLKEAGSQRSLDKAKILSPGPVVHGKNGKEDK